MKFGLSSVLAAITFIAVPAVNVAAASEAGLAYEDNKLNFVSCDGEKVSARWFESKISLSHAGAAPGDPSSTVKLQSWDGNCITVGWSDDAATFTEIADDKAKPTASYVPYVAWDGSKWAAVRTGLGFYHARIALKDQKHTADHFAAAADWLRRKDANNLGAMALAKALTVQSSSSE